MSVKLNLAVPYHTKQDASGDLDSGYKVYVNKGGHKLGPYPIDITVSDLHDAMKMPHEIFDLVHDEKMIPRFEVDDYEEPSKMVRTRSRLIDFIRPLATERFNKEVIVDVLFKPIGHDNIEPHKRVEYQLCPAVGYAFNEMHKSFEHRHHTGFFKGHSEVEVVAGFVKDLRRLYRDYGFKTRSTETYDEELKRLKRCPLTLEEITDETVVKGRMFQTFPFPHYSTTGDNTGGYGGKCIAFYDFAHFYQHVRSTARELATVNRFTVREAKWPLDNTPIDMHTLNMIWELGSIFYAAEYNFFTRLTGRDYS